MEPTEVTRTRTTRLVLCVATLTFRTSVAELWLLGSSLELKIKDTFTYCTLVQNRKEISYIICDAKVISDVGLLIYTHADQLLGG